MKYDSEALTVRLYELLLIALAGLCIGIGIFSQSVTPAVPDFLGVRIGLAVLSLIAAGTLYVAPFLWRFAGPITYVTLTLHAVLHLFFLHASQLAYAQSIGLVLIAMLTVVSLHDVKWMLGYSILVGGAAAAIGFVLPTTSLHPVLLSTAMAAVPVIGYVAVRSRRIIEDELVATIDEAEIAVRAKAEFLATMSHEIRTPMNGVLGMATLLTDTDLSDTQRDYVETIRLSGDTLLTIINDILDFSKIEADRLELEETPFELRPMIEEALDLLASKAYEKPIDLVCHIDEAVPAALLGDVTRLRQVVVNLVGNAIKFTEHGAVLVSVKKRRTVGGEHELIFAVRDTGIGIPADRIDRLFSSFSQVDSSHTRKYGGTGLGLAISKKLAELMGGSMWVESEVGHGSTFQFTILARASSAVSRVPLKGKQALLAGKRVLLVEDSSVSREAVAAQLRAWGLTVMAPPRGIDALRLLREGGCFDAAVLDMQLADMDSLALARGILEHGADEDQPEDALPLIGLTAPGYPVQTEGLFAAILSKPVRQVPLHEALLRLLGLDSPDLVAPNVDEHGVWIQRNPSLPSAEDVQKALAARDDAPLMPPLRLLLAEDNAVNQKVALRILERLGYEADLAENGQEVLDAFETTSYDAVLMDVQMPELDGLRATALLRATLPPEHQPRIIAMTANAMEGDREQCLNAGMDDYLSKPIRREDLIQALLQCKPLSAIQPDSSPLGASAAIPIRQASALELSAFTLTPGTGTPLPKPYTPAPPSSSPALPSPDEPMPVSTKQVSTEPPFVTPDPHRATVRDDEAAECTEEAIVEAQGIASPQHDAAVPGASATPEARVSSPNATPVADVGPAPAAASPRATEPPTRNPFRRPAPSPTARVLPPARPSDAPPLEPSAPEATATPAEAAQADPASLDASALFPLPPAPRIGAVVPDNDALEEDTVDESEAPLRSAPGGPQRSGSDAATPPPSVVPHVEPPSFDLAAFGAPPSGPSSEAPPPEPLAPDMLSFEALSFEGPPSAEPTSEVPSTEPLPDEPLAAGTLSFDALFFDRPDSEGPVFEGPPVEPPPSPGPAEPPPPAPKPFSVDGLLGDPAFSFPSFELDKLELDKPELDGPELDAPAPPASPVLRQGTPSPAQPPPPSVPEENSRLPMLSVPSQAEPDLPSPTSILVTLREVSGVDDPEFAREVLEGYLRTDLSLIGSVVEGMRTHSNDEVRAATHKLKSSTATLGAAALAKRLAALEAESRNGHFSGDAAARAHALREAVFAFRHTVQAALRLLP